MSKDKFIRVTCPIVQDLDYIGGAVIWVVDEHPKKNVTCVIKALRSDELSDPTYKNDAKTNNKDSSPQPLKFQRPTKSLKEHHTFIECEIPPLWEGERSRIVNYSVTTNPF